MTQLLIIEVMKLRFGVGRTHARTNGDIEALADAMRALKNIALQNSLLPGAKSLVDQCPPDDPDTDVNRGCLLYKEARYEEGLAKFNAAQQVVGYDPHLSYNVALCYYRQVLLVCRKNK